MTIQLSFLRRKALQRSKKKFPWQRTWLWWLLPKYEICVPVITNNDEYTLYIQQKMKLFEIIEAHDEQLKLFH